ncbi:unnamed protein product [Phytophthora fragariaefolia]|uniref:Origin recognition complex subunit 2 n=1 Tax=Phytophthora fragariaefolia TaxID=1490495 RepID=A0A9W6YB04_9STRA|nr:unnamed protein product [Phytophthora fragariaefolia]
MSEGAGLRARFRQRRSEPSGSVELGASSANAYFTSKRIRQRVPRKPKPPPLKQRQATQSERSHQEQEGDGDEDGDEGPSSGLQLPSRGQLLAELRAADEHAEHQAGRFERYFPEWKSELLAGYNLLFYGVGSKLSLLQVSDALGRYYREIAKAKPASRHVTQLYLLIHSIDGAALRNPEAQTCLSWLSKSPFIALIASIDHINGPSIWKEEDSLRFEWLSQNLDTCEPYTDEIELRLAKRAKTADTTSSGVKFILQSLTPTDVATLQELARQQLAAADSAKTRGMKSREIKLAVYQSVYEACRKKLLHSTPLAMKNSVKCLEDHGLLKQSRVQTVEYLEIPLREAIIKMDILQLES